MEMNPVWAVAGVVAILVSLGIIGWAIRRATPPVSITEARHAFNEQRDALHDTFFQSASATGKPRGLRWKSCDFGSGVHLARDKRTRELLAFLPVTIAFEAVAGSDMEGLAAVGNLRCATAVFIFRNRVWHTDGRAVFNLDPAETLRHFANIYDPLDEPGAT
jgi:hypothetical protein